MRTSEPVLRLAKPADAYSLSAFAEKTFRQAFAKFNNKHDFEKYVAHAFTEDKIQSEIINPDPLDIPF